MWELNDPETIILAEIKNLRMKRKDIALSYKLVLYSYTHEVDWNKINKAIIKRWSESGLKWIKKEAWKLM